MSGTYGEQFFRAELAKRLSEAHVMKANHLVQGLAKDHADYRERIGYLEALRDVTAWIEEITDTMTAKPPQRKA
jgi:hypothetical protein